MADTPDNPPPPPPEPQKSPWVYSDFSGNYIPPVPPKPPVGDAPAPLPGEPGSEPHSDAPGAPAGAPAWEPQLVVPEEPAASVVPSPPPPAGAAKPAPKKPSQDDASLAGVIDTIEAIIIALIVALTFRAFVVEAFVIPTGSMSPTLLGAHYKVICPKCGYEFDMDARLDHQIHRDARGNRFVPLQSDPLAELGSNRGVPLDQPPICPNCRYQMTAKEMPQYLETPLLVDGRQAGLRPVDLVWANNGDRILVLKYLYSVMEPNRWDVIVFKEPQRADNNYIKRLIALPGETVQIVNGDIYIQAKDEKDAGKRFIARKPEEIQQALWQLMYNNEYYPTDEGKPRPALPGWPAPVWTNPWEPDAAHAGEWKRGPVMAYNGAGATSLRFHLIPPGAPVNYPPYGLNTLGYNSDLYVDEFIGNNSEFAPRSIVGDLRLETVWTPHDAGAASITLTLGRPNNCYRLTWNKQGMRLDRFKPESKDVKDPNSWEQMKEQTVTLPGIGTGGTLMAGPEFGKSYRLALNNVDHAIQFYVDGKKVLWYEEPWTAAQAIADVERFPADWTNADSRGPAFWSETNKARANTMIQIDVGGACDLSHLKLFRDLYYTQVGDLFQQNNWRATATQDNPLTLGEDEFFAMGDNSRRSSDGRLWSRVHPPLEDLGVRPGIVPRRYLLGKAFFVYWPAGFTPVDPKSDIPIFKDLPLVPNTGSTRSIR